MLESMRTRIRCTPLLALVLLALVAGLASGCGFVDNLDEVLYPSATPLAKDATPGATMVAAEPTAIYTMAATFTWPAPTHTPAPQAAAPTSAPPTVNPTPSQNGHLVYAVGGGILRGDYIGRSPVQVASVPQLESYAFEDGVLAMASNEHVDLIDLNAGALVSLDLTLGAPTEYAQLTWGSTGQALLYAAMIDDPTAPTVGRSVQLIALDANGSELGRALLSDSSGLYLLHYDATTNRAFVLPLRGEQSFDQIQVYDLASGSLVQSISIQGDGAASVSPDGSHVLTTMTAEGGQVAQMLVYDLGQSNGAPRVWEHPTGTHSDAHVWSPDGTKVAFLLRDGATYAEATEGKGLWVLDIASMQAQEILAEDSPAATLIAWAPDGSQIVGLHRGETDGSHYYAVRPDGGDRQILSIPAEATVLGWMPLVASADVPQVTIDPWRARFADAQGSSEALSTVAAEFVSARLQTPEDELTTRLTGYLQETGDIAPPTQVMVKLAGEGLFVAVLPDNGIYLLDSGRAILIARGHMLVDARLEGSDVGVIYAMVSGDTVQPTYLVQRRQADGTWSMLWAPLGQRDWIATDGQIAFGGEGLAQINVRGSSFGLDLGQDQVFGECRACPHRWLVGTWLRSDDGYVRHTSLESGASLSAMTWEMTELRPYSLTHEVLRRLRRGEPTDSLVTAEAIEQARALGLLESGMLLRPDVEKPDGVEFSTMDGSQRFTASVQGPQIVAFTRSQ